MQDEEETKKHSKVITFFSPNNRSMKLLKNQKKVYENKTETTKNTFKQHTCNNAYKKRRTKKIESYYLLINQK